MVNSALGYQVGGCIMHCTLSLRPCGLFSRIRQVTPMCILPHLMHGSLGRRGSAFQTPHEAVLQIGSQLVHRFCTVPNTETYNKTDIQTTERVTRSAIGRIYAMHAVWPMACSNEALHAQVRELRFMCSEPNIKACSQQMN